MSEAFVLVMVQLLKGQMSEPRLGGVSGGRGRSPKEISDEMGRLMEEKERVEDLLRTVRMWFMLSDFW